MQEKINFLDHFYKQGPQDTYTLEKNVNDHPYSSLADLLLLYHYKKTNHPAFEMRAKKTVLHFKNSHWLQFLLEQTLNEEAATEVISQSSPAEKVKEIAENVAEHETFPGESLISTAEVTQSLSPQDFTNEFQEVTRNPLPGELLEAPQQPNEINFGTDAEISQEQNFHEEDKAVGTTGSISEEISFEPLHTVDYFASQGIKLTDEPITNDKLGNQMKSFTAWLKSMKKLHPSKLEEQNPATEKIIQNSAEESNINTEILTEAMAEVLIKQDKREKAIEMFSKLSLINPSKRAYFAAKIESIKSL